MDETKINTPTDETITTDSQSPLERGQITVPPRVTEALAGAATRGDVLVAERRAAAVETSQAIYAGAQEAGLDIGAPLYDESGNLNPEAASLANSQTGLASHR